MPVQQMLRTYPPDMDDRTRVQDAMQAMSEGRVGRLLALIADDVTWQWMGVGRWSRAFAGKQAVINALFGGATDQLGPSSRVEVSHVHADGEFVLVEHVGRNVLPDGRNYNNRYCWVFRFQNGLIQEVREYMDTQLVTETFGVDEEAQS